MDCILDSALRGRGARLNEKTRAARHSAAAGDVRIENSFAGSSSNHTRTPARPEPRDVTAEFSPETSPARFPRASLPASPEVSRKRPGKRR